MTSPASVIRLEATKIVGRFFGNNNRDFVALIALAVHRLAKIRDVTVDAIATNSAELALLLSGVQSVRLLTGALKQGDLIYEINFECAQESVSAIISHATVIAGVVACRRTTDSAKCARAMRDVRRYRAAAFRATLNAMSTQDRKAVDQFCSAVEAGVAQWRKEEAAVADMIASLGGEKTSVMLFWAQIHATIRFRDVLLEMIHDATSAEN